MSEQETQGSVGGSAPQLDGQTPAQDATVHAQTHEALAEPVHVLPASRPDTPAPVQHPVAPPSSDPGMTFKEFSQMAGALVFVICFVALGLHAIYYAGY